MFTDPEYLPFMTVLIPETAPVEYLFFASKSLPFLGIIFGNLFIIVRENTFPLLLFFFFQETKELEGKIVWEGEDRRSYGSICLHSFAQPFIQEILGFVRKNIEIKAVAYLKFLPGWKRYQ